jgi:hypothetical protein
MTSRLAASLAAGKTVTVKLDLDHENFSSRTTIRIAIRMM